MKIEELRGVQIEAWREVFEAARQTSHDFPAFIAAVTDDADQGKHRVAMQHRCEGCREYHNEVSDPPSPDGRLDMYYDGECHNNECTDAPGWYCPGH
ncbi:hypothetical protein [Streptomyces sp. NPDC002644]